MMQGSFAERLRVLRAQRGLALTEAAEQIGIDRHTLRALELGERTPRYPTLAKIAEGYGVPVEELLEEPALAGKAEAPSPGPARRATPEEVEFLEWAEGAAVAELREELDKWNAAASAAKEREEAFFEVRGGKPRELGELREMSRDPEYRRLQEETFYAVRRVIWLDRELRRRPGQVAATIHSHAPGQRPTVRWYVPEDAREPYREKLADRLPEGYDEEEAGEVRVEAVLVGG